MDDALQEGLDEAPAYGIQRRERVVVSLTKYVRSQSREPYQFDRRSALLPFVTTDTNRFSATSKEVENVARERVLTR